MAGVSIITSDEIMEITQLVFDRYYTELKRQLRKSELPEEEENPDHGEVPEEGEDPEAGIEPEV